MQQDEYDEYDDDDDVISFRQFQLEKQKLLRQCPQVKKKR
jgi:hypothetical protein